MGRPLPICPWRVDWVSNLAIQFLPRTSSLKPWPDSLNPGPYCHTFSLSGILGLRAAFLEPHFCQATWSVLAVSFLWPHCQKQPSAGAQLNSDTSSGTVWRCELPFRLLFSLFRGACPRQKFEGCFCHQCPPPGQAQGFQVLWAYQKALLK